MAELEPEHDNRKHRKLDELLALNRDESFRSRISSDGSQRSLVGDGFFRAMTFGELAEADRPEDELETNGIEKSIFARDIRSIINATMKSMIMIAVGLTTLFIIMLILFFTVSWQPKNNYGGITLAYLDHDGDMIGAAVLLAMNSSAMPFTWKQLPNTTSIDDLRSQVDRGDWNVALVAHPGATHALMAALLNPKAAYSPTNATSYIFDQGRSGSSMATIIRTAMTNVIAGVNGGLAARLTRSLAAAGTVPLPALNPQVLVSPVGVAEVNLHPVPYTGEFVATDFGEAPAARRGPCRACVRRAAPRRAAQPGLRRRPY